ncbi:MAG: hypothetical protein HEP70_06480 [Rhodobiaceae bacterium]|nr:hypothetical protein [Rhodobiaceae bacterium]
MTFEFEVSDDFAISKPAEAGCPNLDACGQCRVHEKLEDLGFRGCAVFECYGAGQRVTQELFGGRTWQEDESLMRPMARRFRQVRRLHELLMLLEAAAVLPLSPPDEARRKSLAQAVDVIAAQSSEDIAVDEVYAQVHDFLQSLKPYAAAAPASAPRRKF